MSEITQQTKSSTMEEGGAKGRAAKKESTRNADTPIIFPTPKYVFNIFSPSEMITSENNIAQQNLIKTNWNGFVFDTASTSNDPKRVRVKLSSLIVKMLNRLIKEKLLPKEAIFILMGQTHIFVQILCSSSALPTLMQRCERLGVGNV